MAKRTATVSWENDLLTGHGSVVVGSGAIPKFPVTWASRTEEPEGRTSPEELLAAAHASCYSMALSAALARRRTPSTLLEVTSVFSFEKVGDGWKVVSSDLSVKGTVPGVDARTFEEVARAAENACPISNAIRGNVEVRLSVSLAA